MEVVNKILIFATTVVAHTGLEVFCNLPDINSVTHIQNVESPHGSNDLETYEPLTRVSINVGYPENNPLDLKSLSEMFPHLETLEIIGDCKRVPLELRNNFDLSSFVLKNLRIFGCKLREEDVEKIFKLKNLEILDLSNSDLSGRSLGNQTTSATSSEPNSNEVYCGFKDTLVGLYLNNCLLDARTFKRFTNCERLEELRAFRCNRLRCLNEETEFGNLKKTVKKIDFAGCRLELAVVRKLREFERLEELDLYGNDLFSLGNDFNFGNLEGTIKKLRLENCFLKKPILEKLAGFTELEVLNLSRNGCLTLPDNWKCIGKIKKLYISNNCMYLGGLEGFSSRFPSLVFLDISENGLKDSDVEQLSSLTNLEYLDVSKNRICDVGMGYIGFLRNLKHLNMSDNVAYDTDGYPDDQFSQPYCDAVNPGLEAIATLNNLEYLNMSGCRLGPEDLKRIAGMWRLTCLAVENCGIRSDGAKSLSKGSCDLFYLNISKNDIGEEGGKKIVKKFKSLVSLEMESCLIGNETVQKIVNNLHNLKRLNISNNPVGKDDAKNIPQIKSLVSLRVSNNHAGAEGMAQTSRQDNHPQL